MSQKSYRRLCLVFDVLMLICVAGLIACMFVREPKEHYDVDRSVYPVKGIDVSAHNGIIDFDAVAQDTVQFVYIKVTEGTDFCDAKFNINYRNARKAGLKVGPYHFFRFDTPADVQARHLLLSVKGHTFDLPIAIDVEEWGNPETYETKDVRKGLRTMVDAIRAEGYPVVIYTNKRGFKSYIKGYFEDTPLWLCALSTKIPNRATMWQHSHHSNIKGINGPVDQNTFNGSAVDFNRFIRQYTVE